MDSWPTTKSKGRENPKCGHRLEILASSLGEFEFTEPSLGVTLGLGVTHITHFIVCPSTFIDPLCHVQCIGHPKKEMAILKIVILI